MIRILEVGIKNLLNNTYSIKVAVEIYKIIAILLENHLLEKYYCQRNERTIPNF